MKLRNENVNNAEIPNLSAQQKAQWQCDVFHRWGGKKTVRTYKKSLLQRIL